MRRYSGRERKYVAWLKNDVKQRMGIMKVAELAGIISGIKTALPVSMDLVSAPSNMRKTGNEFAHAMKHTTISGMIGMSYENGMNNQLGREDKEMNFEAQKPLWMVTSGLKNLGTNKDGTKLYLPIKVQSCSKSVYIADGIDVTEQVKPFIRESVSPHTQANLETKVIWRTPALDSIVKIRMLGAEYEVEA